MAILFIYRGLPGSGKTTAACKKIREIGRTALLAGRDHIREELGIAGGVGTKSEENQVTDVQYARIREALFNGSDVHVDDMNLREAYVNRLKAEALALGAGFEIVDLRTVDLQTCIANDAKRAAEGGRSVGAAVIHSLYGRYFVPQSGKTKGRKGMPDTYKPKLYTPNVNKPVGFIVDIDGTVALKGPNRTFYDYDARVLDDKPNKPVIDLVRGLINLGRKPVFMSGRADSCRAETQSWIYRHVTAVDAPLFMRPRSQLGVPDYIIKDQLFEQCVAPNYAIDLAIDDRNQIVDLWRAKGIPAIQVADGNF